MVAICAAGVSDSGKLSREVVLDIWKILLEVDDAGDEDNFFDLGGDSLLAVEFTAAVDERLGLELALDVFFDDPTFGAVVEMVRRAAVEA
jgi:acyl carrier protein